MSKFTKRVSASLGALAIAAIALAGATPANAAPANIDAGEARSLTVHAFENGAGTAGDGSLQTGLTDPVEGIPFTAQRVTAIGGQAIDLNTTEGWDRIAPYVSGASAFAPAGATLVAGGTATSNAAGAAEFGSLPIGLYWVTAALPNPNTNHVAGVPQPFLVTLPMPLTDATGNAVPGEWRYDVHAYPKPTMTSAVKRLQYVNSADPATMTHVGLGSLVDWHIDLALPADRTGMTGFRFEDTLPEHLQYVSHSYNWDCPNGGLASATRYVQTYDPATRTAVFHTRGDAMARMEITCPAGVAYTVTMRVQARVIDVPADGVITNTGTATYSTTDGDTTIPVSATDTWGQARINKVVSGDTTKRLDGAEFQVFATEAAAQTAIAAVNAGTATVGAITSQPIGGGTAASTFTTATVSGDEGFVTIPGLRAEAAGTDYWIVETKAPAGYVRATTPTRVTVTPGLTSTNNVIAEVANVQQTPGTLPVLGSNGMTVAMIGGSALLVGGLLFALFGRRRKAGAEEVGA